MNEYDINVQDFRLAKSVEDAESIANAFKVDQYILKAQVKAGGRGLGHFADGFKSGIHFTADPKEVPKLTAKMLGNNLITNQTTNEGLIVNEVLIAEAVDILKESYLAILLDRETSCPVIVASSTGGVDIEEVAVNNPSAIHKVFIDTQEGFTDEQRAQVAEFLGFSRSSAVHKDATSELSKLYRLFIDLDCLQVEINPFSHVRGDRVVSVDAKFTFDNNASYRQPRIAALAMDERSADLAAAGPDSLLAKEIAAEDNGLTYIGLDNGNIGCLVNGAGLAMATMDIIEFHGGKAANFLDLGGRATQSDVEAALRILTGDVRVKCVLINIFGGIVDCAMVAKGIVAACKGCNPNLPIIVRIEGTNVKEAREVLRNSGVNIKVASDMDEGATMAMTTAKAYSKARQSHS